MLRLPGIPPMADDLTRLKKRPLAIKLRLNEQPAKEDQPMDLAEWCLAEAFFAEKGVV